MRLLLTIFLMSAALLGNAQFGLDRVEEFGPNKGNLKMYYYLPKTIDYSEPVPLVFVLHGCTQSAEMISSETGWNKLADSLNFVVVYPEQKQMNNSTKCFNFYLGFKAKKDKGEVASLKSMVNYALKRFSIDSSRIFITGMSAGGAMSNAMMNAYPELFKAGAILAGPSNLFNPNTSEIQPKVAILQGVDDRIVPKKNAEKIKLQWLKKHQIDTSQVESKVDYLNNPLLTANLYYNSAKEVKVITLYAAGIRHKLLIKPGKKITQGGKMDFHTVDVNFHSTYWIAQFFGLTKK